ncbi:taste receptor type 2 member 9-like [Hemicordylus capensis]|uniref:taste receptor type 2 member 9-like n=1 Tax=Hemicordylus capensis TaxID=884348 RepID=UPI0023037DFB|nr:taste receptor type 2 member 9-like [Hemicordylus capensis]
MVSSSVWDTASMLVVITASLGRLWTDTFILVVNCRDWIQKKRLSPVDRILTLQSISRICLACSETFWYLLAKFDPQISQNLHIFKASMSVFWFFLFWNLWLTACLCSYYCLKITDFSNPFFIYFKLRISGLVPTWLLGSVILSLANTLPYICVNMETVDNGEISNFFKNKTENSIYQSKIQLHVLILVGLGSSAAFSLCITSAFLLIFSLWRHSQKMRTASISSRSPSAAAHVQAVKIILFLLINHVAAFLAMLMIFSSNFDRNSFATFVAVSFTHWCPSVDSFISVWGNTKLKNELHKLLYFAKCKGRYC